eukprot:TRINITY_DN752_c0_g1_i1.p1 TRINITY_DN752_c0_g1~~TRINITY_DN752_c0_g1_i1.p1  ORF type:complete len:284 (-),score=63.48 TRINITY_DN752_c0_g1_i1:38-889(-)
MNKKPWTLDRIINFVKKQKVSEDKDVESKSAADGDGETIEKGKKTNTVTVTGQLERLMNEEDAMTLDLGASRTLMQGFLLSKLSEEVRSKHLKQAQISPERASQMMSAAEKARIFFNEVEVVNRKRLPTSEEDWCIDLPTQQSSVHCIANAVFLRHEIGNITKEDVLTEMATRKRDMEEWQFGKILKEDDDPTLNALQQFLMGPHQELNDLLKNVEVIVKENTLLTETLKRIQEEKEQVQSKCQKLEEELSKGHVDQQSLDERRKVCEELSQSLSKVLECKNV